MPPTCLRWRWQAVWLSPSSPQHLTSIPPAPECKSQEVSCLRKTINMKYQDYRLPHLQISPAHVYLSPQFMPSQCQAVQISCLFPKWPDLWFLALLGPFVVRAELSAVMPHQKSSYHGDGWYIFFLCPTQVKACVFSPVKRKHKFWKLSFLLYDLQVLYLPSELLIITNHLWSSS